VCILFKKTYISAKLTFHITKERIGNSCHLTGDKIIYINYINLIQSDTGDFNQFIKNLDDALKHTFTHTKLFFTK